jgi:predicted nucleic acid-binding protein
MFLLDTNVVSELRKPRPDPNVVSWTSGLAPGSAFVSVVTIGEIARGVAHRRRDNPPHADALHAWLDRLLAEYGDRVLPIDAPIAKRWGLLVDAHPELAVDMLLAATALEHDLTVATRNEDHIRRSGAAVVNPFRPSASKRR